MSDHAMRRHEREVTDPALVAAIITGCTVCHVGFVDDGEPYVVPFNVGFELPATDGEPARFWFHSARDGRKVPLIATGQRVCVQMEQDLGLVTHPEKACAWTQAYRSVMAWGPVRAARDREEARHGLEVLMRQHAGRGGWSYPDTMLDAHPGVVRRGGAPDRQGAPGQGRRRRGGRRVTTMPQFGEIMGIVAALIFAWTSVFFTTAGQRLGVTTLNLLRLLGGTTLLGVTHLVVYGDLWPDGAAGEHPLDRAERHRRAGHR